MCMLYVCACSHLKDLPTKYVPTNIYTPSNILNPNPILSLSPSFSLAVHPSSHVFHNLCTLPNP